MSGLKNLEKGFLKTGGIDDLRIGGLISNIENGSTKLHWVLRAVERDQRRKGKWVKINDY